MGGGVGGGRGVKGVVHTPQKMPPPHVLKVLCLQVDFETNENHKSYSVGVTAGLTQVRTQLGLVWGLHLARCPGVSHCLLPTSRVFHVQGGAPEDSALSFKREVEMGSEVRVGASSLNLGPGERGGSTDRLCGAAHPEGKFGAQLAGWGPRHRPSSEGQELWGYLYPLHQIF